VHIAHLVPHSQLCCACGWCTAFATDAHQREQATPRACHSRVRARRTYPAGHAQTKREQTMRASRACTRDHPNANARTPQRRQPRPCARAARHSRVRARRTYPAVHAQPKREQVSRRVRTRVCTVRHGSLLVYCILSSAVYMWLYSHQNARAARQCGAVRSQRRPRPSTHASRAHARVASHISDAGAIRSASTRPSDSRAKDPG